MSDDLIKRVCQSWVDAGLGDETFWENWPNCPTDDTLSAKQVLDRIEQLERDLAKALVFSNADAVPKNVTIYTTRESIESIMIWYGSHHEGDRYTVSFDKRNVPMDNWGWPT